MNKLKVDFSSTEGMVKPLHGVCCAPYSPSCGENQTNIKKYFNEGRIPFCRLHDCCGSYGGSHFVDVPNIFKDFEADETNPDNYDFHYTDEYISAIESTGCKTYYRLGVTIEWGSKKYSTVKPADFDKWARICEHIIRHYNQGWADGFEYNIEYWEIWNEPENPGNAHGPSMWSGTKEEFYELYKISSKHLKKCFPEIKIGGYGSCGFYATTREEVPDGFDRFIPYFTDFLRMVRENLCPLDFFSWHIYTGDVKEILEHGKYVRETLDKYGFEKTESHLNEWNIHSEGSGFAAKHTMEGAAFNAAVLAMLQNTSYVDKAMYYCFSGSSRYNGFINHNDGLTDKPWYAFVWFGKLFELKNYVRVICEGSIYACAAKGEIERAILISNYASKDEDVTLDISGLTGESELTVSELSENKEIEKQISFSVTDKTVIKLKIPERTVLYIEIFNN